MLDNSARLGESIDVLHQYFLGDVAVQTAQKFIQLLLFGEVGKFLRRASERSNIAREFDLVLLRAPCQFVSCFALSIS